MTLSHSRNESNRMNRKEGNKPISPSQHPFNVGLMKRSFSGSNYGSLLRPLIQQSSSTGLEDRPPPPPAPTQIQQKRGGGLFTRLNPHQFQNVFTPGVFGESSSLRRLADDERQRRQENLINNCRSDERKQNLTQSSAHKNISNNVSSTSVQRRLHQIQQSSELAAKPDASTTVRAKCCNLII